MVGDWEKMNDAIFKVAHRSSQHLPLFRLYLAQVLQDASKLAAAQAKKKRGIVGVDRGEMKQSFRGL